MTIEQAQIIIGNIPIDGQDECYSLAQYQEAKAVAIDTMRKYQMLQADYNARLKADMVAMLEQLDLEIQEQIAFIGDCEEANGMKRADNLVKDKINALKQSIWQDNYNGKKEKPKEVDNEKEKTLL